METLLLLIVAGTVVLGSYLIVNLTVSYFSASDSEVYGNYNKRRRENQAFSNFQKKVSKKAISLRSKVF